jgi:acetyltransferase-like isoleucine patch superfamily enzyme
VDGILSLESWLGSRLPIYIGVGRGGTLWIKGDFAVGPGCRIFVDDGASLEIGGRLKESGSGITERSTIMVRRRLSIGTDFICAWNAFITDSDWHHIADQSPTEETTIGNHVWITPNCSILKGSSIGDGSIIATGCVTHKSVFPQNALIGGHPARVLAENRTWKRDLAK